MNGIFKYCVSTVAWEVEVDCIIIVYVTGTAQDLKGKEFLLCNLF